MQRFTALGIGPFSTGRAGRKGADGGRGVSSEAASARSASRIPERSAPTADTCTR